MQLGREDFQAEEGACILKVESNLENLYIPRLKGLTSDLFIFWDIRQILGRGIAKHLAAQRYVLPLIARSRHPASISIINYT